MDNIDQVCEAIVKNIEGGVICAVLNLADAEILGICNISTDKEFSDEMLVLITKEIFQNFNPKNISTPYQATDNKPTSGGHLIKEINVGPTCYHYFAKKFNYGKAVVLLITKSTISLGMGWIQLKAVIPNLERALL